MDMNFRSKSSVLDVGPRSLSKKEFSKIQVYMKLGGALTTYVRLGLLQLTCYKIAVLR